MNGRLGGPAGLGTNRLRRHQVDLRQALGEPHRLRMHQAGGQQAADQHTGQPPMGSLPGAPDGAALTGLRWDRSHAVDELRVVIG